MRPWQIVLALALAFLGGWWVARANASGRSTTATAATWNLQDLRSVGELRVLATRLSVFEEATALDPDRRYAGVVPVVLVYGIDLSKARIEDTPAGRQVLLPPVRVLRRTVDADPSARLTWEARGVQQAPGETISLPHLAELQALGSAEREATRLGLPARATARCQALVEGWLRAAGVTGVTVRIGPP